MTGHGGARRARRRRPSLLITLGIVIGGLALGGAAAHLTTASRPAPPPLVTTLPSGAGGDVPGGPGTAPVGSLPPGAGTLGIGGAPPFPGMPAGAAVPPLPAGMPGAALPPVAAGAAGAATVGGRSGTPPSGVPDPAAAAPAPALVTSVDGDTVTLMTAEGPQRVRLAPTTRVQKQVPAERAEIAPGQLVVVRGEPQDDELLAGTIEIVGGPLTSAASLAPGPGAALAGPSPAP
ncbi:MAG TPA: hypothetical protein VK066_29500 [Chloroflexota bacterium]|nr:hypothetical protein [Chloroflexota bacterium]